MGVSRIHRLLRLITLLQSGGSRSVAELIEELGISRRTLFRDLNMLELAGIPYYHEPGKGYRINKRFFLPPINLTVPETLGLMMLGKTAAAQRTQPMAGAALSAIYKLINSVPEPIRSACGELMSQVTVDPGARIEGDAEARYYPVLQRCIDEARVCSIQYQSPVEPAPIVGQLHPYALHFAARAWYVFGHSTVHQQVRIFKLARLESLQPLPKRFDKPRQFSVRDKLGDAWQLIPEGRSYHVELEFTPKVATNVSEVRWHPSQQQQILPDGRCIMRFKVDGLSEIAWWLCGYADQVTVRKPVALKRRVRAMFQSALKNYRD